MHCGSNLAAGAAVIGTLCGGLEDIKGADGEKLVTSKLFGGAALVFVIFGAFIAFQTTTLRFTFDDSAFALVKADGSTSGENVVVGGENRCATCHTPKQIALEQYTGSDLGGDQHWKCAPDVQHGRERIQTVWVVRMPLKSGAKME